MCNAKKPQNIVMTMGALIIGDDEHDDLHMRSVLLDTISDAVAAAGLAIMGEYVRNSSHLVLP